jgi:hypothetical protein
MPLLSILGKYRADNIMNIFKKISYLKLEKEIIKEKGNVIIYINIDVKTGTIFQSIFSINITDFTLEIIENE